MGDILYRSRYFVYLYIYVTCEVGNLVFAFHNFTFTIQDVWRHICFYENRILEYNKVVKRLWDDDIMKTKKTKL